MTKIITQNISIEKTARYSFFGKSEGEVEELWFVLHGYGQLAEDFIKQFKILDNGKNLVVAPEALNRFYLKGFYGKIGATWMTKEDRENEIKDYINYLNTLGGHILKTVKPKRINVLGFSQGTATACRWLNSNKLTADSLILWSGGVTPDIDLTNRDSFFRKLKLRLVIGKKDELVTKEQIEEQGQKLRENNIDHKLVVFEGGHSIEPEIMRSLLNQAG